LLILALLLWRRRAQRSQVHIVDMHTTSSTKNHSEIAESTPLLRYAEKGPEDEPLVTLKPWFARHAVRVLMCSSIAALVILPFIVFEGGSIQQSHKTTSTCLTPACVHASSEILYNLSPEYRNIDPCTDFEQLVCGGWNDRHDLRPDQGDAFTGTLMFESSQMLLRHILEAPYPSESKHSSFSPARLVHSLSSIDQENFNKLKDAYDACIDEDKIKKDGAAPLMNILSQITDMFPIQESADEEERSRKQGH
jgi:endothelin-converting enzyme